MILQAMLSDAGGDIPVTAEMKGMPFRIDLSETHPFLTLGDYFNAIHSFLFKDRAGPLKAAIHAIYHTAFDPDDMEKMIIRSEKHGALYHVASVEVFHTDFHVRLAVNTALSDRARKGLHHEYGVLGSLNGESGPAYLPRLFSLKDLDYESEAGEKDRMTMSLGIWFEDHHEWHFTGQNPGKGQRIRLWDQNRGHRFLTEWEKHDLFRQASAILTHYYDTKDFRQIYPWHHAAGDFTVKPGRERLEVRLTTARRYERLMAVPDNREAAPLLALMQFFLNLTIKMRLDRVDGTGEVIWGERDILPAVIEGFFHGLGKRAAELLYLAGQKEDLLELLKSFTSAEWEKVLMPLLDLYGKENPADYQVIRENLSDHAVQLYRVLQDFHG